MTPVSVPSECMPTSRFEQEVLAVTKASKKCSWLKCIHLLLYTSSAPSPDFLFFTLAFSLVYWVLKLFHFFPLLSLVGVANCIMSNYRLILMMLCEQAVEQVLYNGYSWYKPATELTYVTLTHCWNHQQLTQFLAEPCFVHPCWNRPCLWCRKGRIFPRTAR